MVARVTVRLSAVRLTDYRQANAAGKEAEGIAVDGIGVQRLGEGQHHHRVWSNIGSAIGRRDHLQLGRGDVSGRAGIKSAEEEVAVVTNQIGHADGLHEDACVSRQRIGGREGDHRAIDGDVAGHPRASLLHANANSVVVDAGGIDSFVESEYHTGIDWHSVAPLVGMTAVTKGLLWSGVATAAVVNCC